MKKKTDNNPTPQCIFCGKEFDKKEVARIYGKFSPVYERNFCSPQCYTSSVSPEPAVVVNDLPTELELSPFKAGMVGTDFDNPIKANGHFQVTGSNPIPLATEVCKRYNAYPELVEALKAIINNWDERMAGYREVFKEKPVVGDGPGYWSPSASMVSSQFISQARAVLQTNKEQ